jgi:hypothetical protein
MSSTTAAANNGKSSKDAQNNQRGAVTKRNTLNLRNLPTQVSGFPEALFTKYSLQMDVTGLNQVTLRLRELDEEGNPGKYVQLEDALRLTRAVGFVKACSKEVARNEDTEKTRTLFYNAKFDEKKVSDPKAFTKSILTYEENLNKSALAIKRSDDSLEDKAAVAFLKKQVMKGREVLDAYIDQKKDGKKVTIREVAFEKFMPAAAVSKVLTGSIDVPANGRLWTSLFGRELDKFCNLTLREIKTFPGTELDCYLPEEAVVRYRALCTDDAMKEAFGTDKDLSEKQKEKYLEQPVPIRPLLGLTAMLRRAEATKAVVRLRQTTNAVFPKITEEVNATLMEYYVCPPLDMSMVKAYWDRMANTTLRAPDLVSSSYRTQTLEALEESGAHQTREFPAAALEGDVYQWKGMPLHVRTMKLSNAEIRDVGLEKYQPPEIVGFEKKLKQKDKQRKAVARKNNLTDESRKYLKGLVKAKIPNETLKSVKEFLESFLYIKMQEMAAHIVYMTCRLAPDEARKIILYEEKEEVEEPPDEGGEEEKDNEPDPELPAALAPAGEVNQE